MIKEQEKTKEAIIACARKLFIKFGFEKTSMDDIAKSSHKAKGSIYYHFTSKDDLIANVLRDEMNKLKALLNEILTDEKKSEIDRFSLYLSKRMELLNSALTYHQALKNDIVNIALNTIDELVTSEHFIVIANDFYKWEERELTKLISEGKDNGSIKQDIDTSLFVNMILMVIKSLEVPFFMKGKYQFFASIFQTLVTNMSQTLSPSFTSDLITKNK